MKKVWISSLGLDYTVHLTEPDSEKLGYWHSILYWPNVCKFSLKELGFIPLPLDDECNEYRLGGDKPKLICTWVRE